MSQIPTEAPHDADAVGIRGWVFGYFVSNYVEKVSVSIWRVFSKLHIGSFFKVSGFVEGCKMGLEHLEMRLRSLPWETSKGIPPPMCICFEMPSVNTIPVVISAM